eukprot:c6930_g1_i1.p1 GENE.c6930_g1_i1~~c6930_g1_i1.p1  ORF type:complete len:165 (+),score=21.49 c6930_g1_i1:70-495(+)
MDGALMVDDDCLEMVLMFCRPKDALAFSATCKQASRVFQTCPQRFWASWFVQAVFNQELKSVSTLSTEFVELCDWKAATKTYAQHMNLLRTLPSPGCQYQKYLRWLEVICLSTTNTNTHARAPTKAHKGQQNSQPPKQRLG